MGYNVTFGTLHVPENDSIQQSCYATVCYWGQATQYATKREQLLQAAQAYCHVMDAYYRIYGSPFAGGEWLDRRC